MIRPTLLCLFALIWAPLAQAQSLAVPEGADLTWDEPLGQGGLTLPVGPFDGTAVPTILAEGPVRHRVWQLTGETGAKQTLYQPLRDSVLGDGFEVLLECRDRDCGGFDFRFAIDILPDPVMHVDLGDFLFLSAQRGDGDTAEYIMILASQSAAHGFVQVTTVNTQDAAAPIRSTKANPVEEVGATPPPQPSEMDPTLPLAELLLQRGSAVLADLEFDSGTTSLGAGPYPSLTALAAFLQDTPDAQVMLVGHTDTSGGLEANMKISQARAQAVLDRLVSDYGIAAERLGAFGAGFMAPRSSNLTDAGRTQNRRVEVVLTTAP